jgi:integrase
VPREYLMTWEHQRRRWAKMYQGKRYTVSPSVLSKRFAVAVPETQDGSYQYANEWWKAKKTEIDAAGLPIPAPRTQLPLEDVAAAALGVSPADFFNRLLAFWNRHKNEETGARSVAEQDAKEIIENVWRELGRTIIENRPLPDGIDAQLPPARLHQLRDAVKAIRGESAAATDCTIKAHAGAWLAVQEKQVEAGQLTAARVNNVRMALAHFTRWLGETADVAGIDAAKLQGFYEYCLTQVAARRKDSKAGWSLPFAKEVFAVARSWLRWLTEQGTIDPPRNLARRFKFGSTAKKILTWSVDEVQHVIGEAPGKLKLALLLMVNCGMTQVDVSDLKDEEVNWKHKTITRRRSKTKDNENVPVVTYRLWPLTFKLLKKHRSGAERVLLTESGKPYVRSEMVNGKLVKADGFTSNYAHLKRRLKFTKSMKLLRKTAATLLESHREYGRLVPHFLGHSPRGVAAKHYAAPPQELFDEALTWLGKQLGFIE